MPNDLTNQINGVMSDLRYGKLTDWVSSNIQYTSNETYYNKC